MVVTASYAANASVVRAFAFDVATVFVYCGVNDNEFDAGNPVVVVPELHAAKSKHPTYNAAMGKTYRQFERMPSHRHAMQSYYAGASGL